MSVPSFTQFLTESKEGKLTHLTHLEDVLLDEGMHGMDFIMKVLDEFAYMLGGSGVARSFNVTTKWDGAPGVVFGPDPADGRFFVATKSAFNKSPKLMKSHADISAAYGDGGLAQKLHICLNELPHPPRVLQGDLLFSSQDLKMQEVDGKSFVSFRPNTILYAVDTESQLGQRILTAELGIVIHTMYVGNGKSIGDYRAAPIAPVVFAAIPHSRRVVALDAKYDDVSGSATFTVGEEHEFLLATSHVESAARQVSAQLANHLSAEPMHGFLTQFLNNAVRTNARGGNADKARLFAEWLVDRRDAEIVKRSTPVGKAGVNQKFNPLIQHVTSNLVRYADWFTLHGAIERAKILVVRKLGQVSAVRTFLPTPSGLKVTGPEGFVAVSHSGRMVKLVDRLEFSRANFLATKEWT